MWPKALAQLIELSPHIARLLPMADRFFATKGNNDEASRRAAEQMDALRGEVGKVTASHESLYRQMNEQSLRLSETAELARAAKAAAESAEARTAAMEQRLARANVLLVATLVVAVALLALVIVLVVRR